MNCIQKFKQYYFYKYNKYKKINKNNHIQYKLLKKKFINVLSKNIS